MDLLSFFLTGSIGCVQIGYAARDAQNDSRWKIIAGCLAYIGAAEICGIFFPNQMIVGLIWQIALIYGVSVLIFRVPAKTAAMDALLAVCLTQLCVGIGSSAQSLLLPPLYGTSAFQPAQAGTVALIVGLSALCCILARRMCPSLDERRFQAAFVVPLLFYCVAEICLLESAYKTAPPEHTAYPLHVALLLLQALGLFAVFCTLAISRRALDALASDFANKILRHELALQRTYVAEASARYNQTRALRHDMRNHLLVVDGLLQTGRVAEGQAYLEKLHAAAELSSLPAHTGNPIVDVLIEGKLAKAREENVDVEIEGALPPRGGLDDFDLCVLFANAFDNALEACRALSARRWIRFSCKCRENLCLLSFENSCRDVLSFREDTGLGNMRSVAEKYNGAIEAHTAGGVFALKILLSTSEPEEDNSESLH